MTMQFKSFYFPSKLILVDDNELFLENLSYELSKDYLIDTYCDPVLAVNKLSDSFSHTEFSTFIQEIQTEDDELHYAIDFSKIKSLSENSHRHKLPTVVIVDYSMPNMNGIEFCKRLSHLPIRKIMLTGHADFKLAVEAFNQGIIDKFLVKDASNMLDEIKSTVNELQATFFERVSSPLYNCLFSKLETPIFSAEYKIHLQQILNDNHVSEYYLLNPLGTYLLIKSDQSKAVFVVMLESQLIEYQEILQSLGGESDLIDKIKRRTHAPILIDEADYKLSVSAWKHLLRPIQKEKGYYFCVIDH